MLYQKLIKPILFAFDPERAHNFFVWWGEFFGQFKIFKKLIGIFFKYKSKDISKVVDGLYYQTPFILSAGYDYNGRLINILPEISFGGEEVGSVTAKPYEGNTKPRLTRLPKSKSILVNKGLKNDGVEKIIERLKKYPKCKGFVVGVSIARSNIKETASTEAGLADYLYSFKRLNEENVGDYYTLNISCPNAFCGETFADPKLLPLLLAKISEVKCQKPIYVKMPINLPWPEFEALLKILAEFPMIKGVIIGNLNKNYDDLDFRDEAPKEYRGGLSGKPTFKLSNDLIRKTRGAYQNRFTIIGCGGVLSAKDMQEKFAAGSDLVMLITGLIWNGPGFIKDLAKNL